MIQGHLNDIWQEMANHKRLFIILSFHFSKFQKQELFYIISSQKNTRAATC